MQKKAKAAVKKVEKSGCQNENVIKAIKSAQSLDEIKQLVSFRWNDHFLLYLQ